jgi:hypothetical protein
VEDQIVEVKDAAKGVHQFGEAVFIKNLQGEIEIWSDAPAQGRTLIASFISPVYVKYTLSGRKAKK